MANYTLSSSQHFVSYCYANVIAGIWHHRPCTTSNIDSSRMCIVKAETLVLCRIVSHLARITSIGISFLWLSHAISVLYFMLSVIEYLPHRHTHGTLIVFDTWPWFYWLCKWRIMAPVCRQLPSDTNIALFTKLIFHLSSLSGLILCWWIINIAYRGW